MADSAISGFTAFGEAPESGDLVEMVDISEATAANRSKYNTVANFFATVVTHDGDIVTHDGDIVTL